MTTLASRFQGKERYTPSQDYRLAPFRFGRLDGVRYIVTNDVGEYVLLSREHLVAFIRRELPTTSVTYQSLKSRHFLFDDESTCALDLLALKALSRAERIAEFTALHIFVVTLRCDHSCHYCQVSRQTEDKSAFDMTREHADRALDFTFRSPARNIKLELQGGEPLLNFDLVRHITERGVELGRSLGKNVQVVIATNLARLTDEALAFCKRHEVCLSTSLDGPEDLHNQHRPVRDGNSYAMTVDGIRRARRALGPDLISALMTTTPASLDRVEEIIDEYVRQEFHGIFLRPLSPYGFAVRTSLVRRYGVEDWLAFYKRGLAYILGLNRRGYLLREDYTSILLRKIFSPAGSSYVDLQSPSGIGIAGIVFNYDGAVYASDEGRMLAEMRDLTFKLGHLDSDSYETIMTSDALLDPIERTLLESAPMCSDCPFLPYCGADPVFHQATLGDPLGHKAFSVFCSKQMGVIRHVMTLLEDDPEARRIMLGWI